MKRNVFKIHIVIGLIISVLISSVIAAEPDFAPIVYKGEDVTIQLEVVGTARGTLYNGSSSTEPAAYDPRTKRLFVIRKPKSGNTPRGVAVLDISDPSSPTEESFIDVTNIDPPDFFIATFVAVKNKILAVAVENVNETAPGRVAFYSTTNGRLLADPVEVGAQPSGLAFTRNGRKVVVVSTGEANDDVDPVGSVSVIDIRRHRHRLVTSVRTDDFSSFNNKGTELVEAGVRIFKSSVSVAEDLEPDSVAISPDSRTAYVTLPPNNAFAVVDIKAAKVIEILPFGNKDHEEPGNGLDASERDEIINIANWPVKGMYQPDLLAVYRAFGQTYLVTPNEGAQRGDNERVKDLLLDPNSFLGPFPDCPPNEELQGNRCLGRLKVTTAQLKGQMGDESQADPDGDGLINELFSFGARSFSIWTTDGQLVFDSGDDFEQITAAAVPEFFNTEDNNNNFDSRSDDRGPEPEAVAVGRIGLRQYAFIVLEQIGGVMVYNITNPYRPHFELYINNRNFLTVPPLNSDDCTQDTEFSGPPPLPSVCAEAGDLGPEGVLFIPRFKSPIDAALLVVTQEISDTTTIYRIDRIRRDDNDKDDDDDKDDDGDG